MWHTILSPCTDLCVHIRKKRHRSNDAVQQQDHDDVEEKCQNYAFMLDNLMDLIQENLLISDDNQHSGALNSLDLVGGTRQQFMTTGSAFGLRTCAAKVSEVCVETTVVVDTLGPARRRTYDLS